MDPYLFTSARLGFRNWEHTDIPAMAVINADPDVMRFFPAPQTEMQTADFVERMQRLYAQEGFCYFAVEILEEKRFIGFTGLAIPLFEASFTPCVDIGWRLHPAVWHQGYAAEGAARCLQYAFEDKKLDSVKAVAPEINLPSVKVMERIGMKKIASFRHPSLLNNERLINCVCYEAVNDNTSH